MAPLRLSPRQRSELEYLAAHDPVAKGRCRAQALLWLDEGEAPEQVADSLRVSRRAVYYRNLAESPRPLGAIPSNGCCQTESLRPA